jgi:hypothetical protein
MIRKRLLALLGAGLSLCIVSGAVAEGQAYEETRHEWKFRVYLDGAEIGYHNYELVNAGGIQRMSTEAEFRVRFLFFTAYRYRHTNIETWSGNCLQHIESSTDANGRPFSIEGKRKAGVFTVQTLDSRYEVQECVKTFAYWNPDFMREEKLLNAQTGELLDVTIEQLPERRLSVRGETRTATRYRVVAKEIDLELWYAKDRSWLGLRSTTKDGRRIHYELI